MNTSLSGSINRNWDHLDCFKSNRKHTSLYGKVLPLVLDYAHRREEEQGRREFDGYRTIPLDEADISEKSDGGPAMLFSQRVVHASKNKLIVFISVIILLTSCNFGFSFPKYNPKVSTITPIALPQDSSGWTVFSPSSDTRLIYVSAAGSDTTGTYYAPSDPAIGSDPQHPVGVIKPFLTYAQAQTVARSGSPDWILFNRGDTFSNVATITPKSGRSKTEYFLISSYGSGALPVLKSVKSSNQSLMEASTSGNSLRYFALKDVDCYASNRDPTNLIDWTGGADANVGFNLLTDTGTYKQILFEGVIFRFFANNTIQLYGASTGSISDFVIRRCSILDNYYDGAHSQGIYANGLQGILIEECVFDHNGWHDPALGGTLGIATMFNHNTYFCDCHNVTFRNNIFMRGSSMNNKFTANLGVGSASNINLENNLYLDGEIGVGMGGNVNTSYKFIGSRIVGNVFTEIGRSCPTNRNLGWGLDVEDWDGGVVDSNYFLHNTTTQVSDSYAISVEGGTRNVSITKNVVYDLDDLGQNPNGAGIRVKSRPAKSGITVSGNFFQEPVQKLYMADFAVASDVAGFLFSDNSYYLKAGVTAAFRVAGADTSWAKWSAATNDTSSISKVLFLEPTRSIATYQGSLGATSSIDSFITACRNQSRDSWDARYTAEAVTAWLKAGFVR